ncbi:PfkB family carbohydrate kinase [Roseibium sediminis]|uniref:PfkB family carbohydrate kinase n=1 Tax=Roseibium sediminis TaxID=1775174 RepID=UPI00123E05E5|nr:PfkB family carbohydrate kinase [Roseibium sediminis]
MPDLQSVRSSPTETWCFGAVHLDTLVHALIPLSADTSTPASFDESLGGVATNVATGLAKLAVPTHLFGAVGNDTAAETVKAMLATTQVHPHLSPLAGSATGRYSAFHQPDGTLALACVESRILEDAGPELVETWLADTPASDRPGIWFADANLPERLLERLADRKAGNLLAVDAVSRAKAPRLKSILAHCDLVFLNRSEASTLTGQPDETAPEELAEALHRMGARSIVLTLGSNGLLWSRGPSDLGLVAPLPVKLVDVTGAGDALIAGTLAGLAHSLPLEQAVLCGRKAAQLTLQSTGATAARLDWTSISRSIHEIQPA